MKTRTAIKWAQNPALATLLLLAFFSRALIPAGFMPGPGGLIVCPAYTSAPTTMAHDMSAMGMAGMDMSHHASPHSGDGGSPQHEGAGFCPFAVAATTMASNHAALSVTVAVDAFVAHTGFLSQRIVPRGTIVPTRLPRGPPAFHA